MLIQYLACLAFIRSSRTTWFRSIGSSPAHPLQTGKPIPAIVHSNGRICCPVRSRCRRCPCRDRSKRRVHNLGAHSGRPGIPPGFPIEIVKCLSVRSETTPLRSFDEESARKQFPALDRGAAKWLSRMQRRSKVRPLLDRSGDDTRTAIASFPINVRTDGRRGTDIDPEVGSWYRLASRWPVRSKGRSRNRTLCCLSWSMKAMTRVSRRCN